MATKNVPDLVPAKVDALVTQIQALTVSMRQQGLLLHRDAPLSTERIVSPDATALAGALAIANEIRTKWALHIADTGKHIAADVTNTIAAPAATDQTSTNTLLNEIKVDLNAHHDVATYHDVGPYKGAVGAAPPDEATADATNEGTSVTLANVLKAMYNRHVDSGAPTLAVVPS